MDKHLTEIQISSELVHDGSFIKLRRDHVRLPDGSAVGPFTRIGLSSSRYGVSGSVGSDDKFTCLPGVF